MKVLDENPTDWPYIIEGILFAHRVSKHTSTKYSPFFLLYNREPTLPIDIKYNLVDIDGDNSDEPFDRETFDAVLSNAISMREEIHQNAGENIQSAQNKQQRDYNRRHQVPNTIKVGQKVLLKNQKREDRKGGKFSFKWLGTYTVHAISNKNLCSLINKDGKQIKTKYNASLLKPYVEPTPLSDEKDVVVNDEKPPVDEKIDSSAPIDQKLPNLWTKLPNEIFEMILIDAVKSSKNVAETYLSVSRTCSRFNEIVQRKKESLLPRIYINFPDVVLESLPRWNDMTKVSVRKILKMFGPFSGVAMSLASIVNDKKWKSAWLIIRPEKHSSFTVERSYWKSSAKVISVEKKESTKVDESEYTAGRTVAVSVFYRKFWLKNPIIYHLQD